MFFLLLLLLHVHISIHVTHGSFWWSFCMLMFNVSFLTSIITLRKSVNCEQCKLFIYLFPNSQDAKANFIAVYHEFQIIFHLFKVNCSICTFLFSILVKIANFDWITKKNMNIIQTKNKNLNNQFAVNKFKYEYIRML